MPRVLRIINRFNLGGISYNVAYLTRYMQPEFETLAIGGPPLPHEESSVFIFESLGIKPLILEKMGREIHPLSDYSVYKQIRQIIREFKPDIVHTHAAKAGALGRWAAYKEKVPVIVHTFHGHVFHSYFGPLRTGFYKNIERSLAKKSNAIIAISEKQKMELTEEHNICAPDKIKVIPLGFDLDHFHENKEEKRKSFREKYDIPEETLVITILGRIVPVKNHKLFLRAVAELSNSYQEPFLALVVGDGPERGELERLCAEMNITSKVKFTSWIKEADQVLAASDIVALTSHNEGTPVSLIEAQAAGIPVVSTRVGGIEDIVSPDTALLSETGNLQAFSQNLIRLAKDKALREHFEKSGWENVGTKFHYKRLVKDMTNLYNSLLSN